MPEINPQDYTPGELTRAANVCKDAVELLKPASAELMSVAEDVDPDHHDEAIHYARTARHLGGAAFHLKGGEAELRKIAENAARTYKGASTLLSRIVTIVALGWPPMLLSKLVLPDHIGHVLADLAGMLAGFGFGIAVANLIFYRRTRRTQSYS